MKKKLISVIFGTRPEAIKLAPVILKLKKDKIFKVNVCVTAQHRQMLDQVLDVFKIKPDADLNIMRANQTLAALTARGIELLDNYISETEPDLVLIQGDTTTTFIASLVSFYHKKTVGHVEAGLRTYNKFAPFPEEINRVITSGISDLHFTPTEKAKKNLLLEGVSPGNIFVTGNTVIDALLIARDKTEKKKTAVPGINEEILSSKYILITGHRRENFGEGFRNICEALLELAQNLPDLSFIYPVHLNPNVQEPVKRILGKTKNIFLIKPLDYLPFVRLMAGCYLILTDSGGVQEEAPSLGKPVLVLRDVTERPEGVESGNAKIAGTNKAGIIEETMKLLNDKELYGRMANAANPYGDGHAAERIADIINLRVR